MLEPIYKRETPRIKSVCYHPTKPIFITAHHDGSIQIYNYLLKSRVALLNDHLGPVRAIAFHPFLEIFASGGDDTLVKIWCFRTKKVLFTFTEHKDYIRSLDFHPTLPYLISSSDDQTVKIFNFQSKKLLSTLIGHTHYVMGVKFFLNNYIVSVSLDQSIRIWDYKRINEKQKGILALPNVVVKQIIEGHEKGVNNVYVYKNMLVTVSDDREVKIWEENNELITLKETLYHHTNIVSSCYLNDNFVITNGEDGLCCKFDFSKRTTEKFSIENKFWCMAEKEGMLLTGHDSGFILFSLKKSQPVFYFSKEELYYVKENSLFFNDFKSETKLHTFTKNTPQQIKLCPTALFDDQRFLFQYENYFEIHKTKIKERGKAVVFDDKIVILKKNKINFMNKEGQIYKTIEKEFDDLFYLKNSIFLGVKNSFVYILNEEFEILKQKNLFKVKEVLVSKKEFCVFGENELAVFDFNYHLISSVKEILPINNGFFYQGALIYSTKNQIKYLFKESGILKSVDNTFILFIKDNSLYYLKEESINKCDLLLHELNFIKCLVKNEDKELKEIIQKGNLLGLSPVDKLIKYNKGELALGFINDLSYKIKLALSAKKYEECYEYCVQLNDKEYFSILANEAIKDCEVEVAEKALVCLKEYKRFIILLVCSKRFDRLREYMNIFGKEENVLVSLFLSDKDALVRILKGKKVGNWDE